MTIEKFFKHLENLLHIEKQGGCDKKAKEILRDMSVLDGYRKDINLLLTNLSHVNDIFRKYGEEYVIR